jgi:probable F420-dependent oxidoreductase
VIFQSLKSPSALSGHDDGVAWAWNNSIEGHVAADGPAISAGNEYEEAYMTKLQLGSIGVVVGSPGDGDVFLDAATELAALGYSTIWLAGPQIQRLEQIGDVVDAAPNVQVASGVISVDRFDPAAVAAAYAEIDAKHPGRFVVGLGGAHGPKPLQTLAGYLDALDTVPPTVPAAARVLAALGPRMLRLARDRAAGAYPLLVTPDYTAQARSLLGEDSALVVGQFVIIEPDPERARELARGPLGFMTARGGGYAANLHRMGFAEDEIAQLSDRLVDAVVAWGDPDAVATRIVEHLHAGADQVALSVLRAGPPGALPVGQWRQLAKALIS